MVDIACRLRIVDGPSLLGEEAAVVLRFPREAGGAARTIAPDVVVRWREICARSAIPVPAKAYQGIAAAAMVAVTLRHIARALSGRAPEPLRERRSRDGTEEFVVTGVPARLAPHAVDLAQRIVALAMQPSPPASTADQVAAAAAALRTDRFEDAPVRPSDPSMAALVAECERVGVPWRPSRIHPGGLLCGEGRFQARFEGTGSLSRPAFGMVVTRDKILTKRYLAGLGLPVATHRVVTSPEEAAAAGERLGFPVVVKPTDGTFSRGVVLDVRDGEEARAAYAHAALHGSGVLVEPYLDIPDFRAMVAAGEAIIVHRRRPPYVVGDGIAPVRALIAAHNRDLAAGRALFAAGIPVAIDEDVERTLGRTGRALDTVPAAGERVELRLLPIRGLGGYAEEVTAQVHPDTMRLFGRVAAVLGLALVAIDFRTTDIARPWHVQRFAILEANVRPGIADIDAGRVARAVIAAEFPDPAASRLPRVVAIDARARSDADPLLRAQAALAPGVAFAGAGGLHLGGVRVLAPPVSPRHALDRAAEDPTVSRILFWLRPADVESHGLGLSTIDRALL
ncbi:MAG: hypothetical protein IT561_13265, partial [Alphaproteobacteria bacterium]|nr:hypothetical protein [Alphaproteobacteria bacterium]